MQDWTVEPTDEVDTVIIGAGPAGATAAITLAQAGRTVLVLERRDFPRFHIGESLSPFMISVFERLNLIDRLRSMNFPEKRGAEFIFPDGGSWRVRLTSQGPGRPDWTVQVERARFDKMLVEHAEQYGARVLMHANVTQLVFDEDRIVGVVYERDGQQYAVRAKYVVDAGGRASKIVAKYGLRKWIPQLRSIAIYRHHTGLDDTKGPNEPGDIQIAGHEDGWVWTIPTGGGVLSVGAVMRKERFQEMTDRTLEDIYTDHIARSPRVVARMADTTPGTDLRLETDYGYFTDTVTGPGWFLVGDAAAFVDPIFSSGVWLAVSTGWSAAQRIDALLDKPEREAEVREDFERLCKTGVDMYARMAFAFYSAFSHHSESEMSGELERIGIEVNGPQFTRLLAGDFWSPRNEPAQIMRGNPAWDFFAPFDRIDYCPIYDPAPDPDRTPNSDLTLDQDRTPDPDLAQDSDLALAHD